MSIISISISLVSSLLPGSSSPLPEMDYAYQGEVFCSIGAKSTIDLDSLDYCYLGEPFESFV